MNKQVPFLDTPLDQLKEPLEEDCNILALAVKQRIYDMFDAVSNDDMLHIFRSSNYFLILRTYQFESDIAYESRCPSQPAHLPSKYDVEQQGPCILYRSYDSCPPQKNYLSCLYYKVQYNSQSKGVWTL